MPSSAFKTDGNPANIPSLCMACKDEACDFEPLEAERRPLGPHDVLIDVKYCGVCHSDLHVAASHNSKMKKVDYPIVPGHEIAGVCVAVGDKVDQSRIKVGMKIGVGVLVDSCLKCSSCKKNREQDCMKRVEAYNNKDYGTKRAYSPCGYTLGGYTKKFVVDENFAIIIPESYPLEAAGPVMCAGITMYTPLRTLNMGPGKNVGIIGQGGLGLLGVQLSKALGCNVTAISRSDKKKELAMKYGADQFLISSGDDDKAGGAFDECHDGSLDIILNTIPIHHDYNKYNKLLKKSGGKQVIMGLHKGMVTAFVMQTLTFGRSKLIAGNIGGIKHTQEVIDLCATNNIIPEIKVMPCHKLNEIYELLDGSNDAGVRYVLDMENTLNEDTAKKCEDVPKTNLKPADFSKTLSLWGGFKDFVKYVLS